MDKTRPAIPEDILPPAYTPTLEFQTTIEDLWKEVLVELTTREYLNRLHQNVGTYDKGCRGPLCRKAQRDHPKRKLPGGVLNRPVREERIYDPILEYFHTVAKHRIRNFQLALYKELAG